LPASAVDDAAQEAVLRAWSAWRRSGAPDHPAAWMATIARREAVRWRSGPPGRSWASATDEPPEPARPALEEDDVLERLDVNEALTHLAPVDRLLIRLRYEADLTQPDIARATGLPEGTVKIRLHRARKKLRSHLS
jgi:RNA polymerase sigma-70 factor, ECF subfamily